MWTGLRSITTNWTGHASYYLLIISILSSGIHTLFPTGICFGIHLKMNDYKPKITMPNQIFPIPVQGM